MCLLMEKNRNGYRKWKKMCKKKRCYRQQVSILCPRGYEPRALPLRHAGETVLLYCGRADLVPAVGFDPTSSPL